MAQDRVVYEVTWRIEGDGALYEAKVASKNVRDALNDVFNHKKVDLDSVRYVCIRVFETIIV